MKVSIIPMTIEPFSAELKPICSENIIAIRNRRNKKTVNVQIIILARSNIQWTYPSGKPQDIKKVIDKKTLLKMSFQQPACR